MSFLAGPNQKLHTDAFDAGDQRPPAEYQYDALFTVHNYRLFCSTKPEKNFSQKLKIS